MTVALVRARQQASLNTDYRTPDRQICPSDGEMIGE